MKFVVVNRCNIFYALKSVDKTTQLYHFLCAEVSEQLIARHQECVKKITLYLSCSHTLS